VSETPTNLPPAGWYADPYGHPVTRWWDGTQWTQHTTPLPEPTPPVPTAQPATEQPTYQQPAQEQPAQEQPTYQQPAYQQPAQGRSSASGSTASGPASSATASGPASSATGRGAVGSAASSRTPSGRATVDSSATIRPIPAHPAGPSTANPELRIAGRVHTTKR
jgi:hypothetical protein